MNPERFPDIEIYLRTNSLECISKWLSTCFESVTSPAPAGNSLKLAGHLHGHTIPITIIRGAAGKHYISIVFDSSNTPWASDLDCARAAFAHTGAEVRCSVGGWEESADASVGEWWQISDQGERRINWEH